MESLLPVPRDPQPMSAFDPTQPVVVHEQFNDVAVEWVPVAPDEWQKKAEWFDDAKTIIRWDEMLLDGWWPAGEEDKAA
jgi:hypothetical protein